MTDIAPTDLPKWEEHQEAICERIASHKTSFKVVLKTREESLFFPMWLSHYRSFLEPHEIIVADNSSADPVLLAHYAELEPEINIFQYKSHPLYGFHNTVHSQEPYSKLYAALDASCDHFIFVDTDEFLFLAKPTSWTADRTQLLETIAQHKGRALATVWMNTIPQSTDTWDLEGGEDVLVRSLAWGKPIRPTRSDGMKKSVIHTAQFPQNCFDARSDSVFVLKHLMNYQLDQRMKVNRLKLEARGIVQINTPFEDIAAMTEDTLELWANGNKQEKTTAIRLIAEIRHTLSKLSDTRKEKNSENLVSFEPAGAIKFSSANALDAYSALFRESERLHEFAFQIARRFLENAGQGHTKTTSLSATQDLLTAFREFVSAGDMTKAEALLRAATVEMPQNLDQYGDPLAHKELTRFLLSQGRFDEATDLVAKAPAIGRAGWHHILFARAYEAKGRPVDALSHWQAFEDHQPGSPEVQSALSRHGVIRKPPEAL